jgi:hypothetical protein
MQVLNEEIKERGPVFVKRCSCDGL